MAQLLAAPFSYFADDNGAPLAGGKVYTYEPGSVDTPKDSYTDESGDFPATNPVELDSAGRAEVWLDGFYKIVVTDADDVVIRSVDHISATNTNGDMRIEVYDPANVAEQLVGETAFQDLTNKRITTIPSSTITASLKVPAGSAPTSPFHGDIWTTAAAALIRMNGTTQSFQTTLDRQVTTADVSNSTSETAIYSFSVPGGNLSTNGQLILSLIGDYLNDTGGGSTLTINVKYGATTIGAFSLGSIAQNAGRRSLQVDCMISAANATNAERSRCRVSLGAVATATGTGAAPGVTQEAVHNSITEDSTVAKTLQVTVTHGTISSNISGRALGVLLTKS